jgi:ubiquinone/menaquinone biosynthesis C-methylase UbiE
VSAHHGARLHRHGDGHMASPRLYDLLGHLFFAGRRPSVFRRLAELSGARAGDRVLDVGCGTGYFTRILVRAVGSEGAALGIDPSAQSLTRARRLNRLPNCSFSDGVAESLVLADGSYDVVVTSLMIHHLPEEHRMRAVEEMFRVLRPGGRVLVADFRPPASALARRLIHGVTSPAMEHNPVRLLEAMLRDAGFEQVEVGDVRPWIHYAVGVKPL